MNTKAFNSMVETLLRGKLSPTETHANIEAVIERLENLKSEKDFNQNSYLKCVAGHLLFHLGFTENQIKDLCERWMVRQIAGNAMGLGEHQSIRLFWGGAMMWRKKYREAFHKERNKRGGRPSKIAVKMLKDYLEGKVEL